MRISSINVAQPRNLNCNLRTKNVQNPNFKGWGGALGTLFGAGVGVALTVASGGALAWTIPALGGVSGIGGDIFEKKDKPSDDEYSYDYDPCYPNPHDY